MQSVEEKAQSLQDPVPDVRNVKNPILSEKSKCPICGESISGAEGGPEINAHIDACLSKDIIHEFSQQPFPGKDYSDTKGYMLYATTSPTKLGIHHVCVF